MKDQILNAAESPHELETLYRTNPKEFTRAFPDAFAARTDSAVMRVWNERLFFEGQPAEPPETSASRWSGRDIGLTVVLALMAGTLAKLPNMFPLLNEERFYTRNLGAIIIGALMVYFSIQKSCRMKIAGTIFTLLLGATLYLNFLPATPHSQTILLSCIHMPFFFWSLLGISFLGGAWRNLPGRMDYLRYNGELLIYSTIVLIGGMVLTGLTFALFAIIDLRIEQWYMKNVVVYGAVASPIVATLLVERMVNRQFKIAPLLAKVFTPLFLLTVVAYLFAMILHRKSPFTDRDFLIAFNGLLLVVLGLCVFSISERGSKERAGIIDVMNIGMVSVTLIIDVIALAAILFRLSSYGFTPNRIAVLGANLLAFCHLAGILWHYARFAGRKAGPVGLDQWIVRYLPAYTTWSLVVAVAFPIMFWFQ
ncbi:MAG: DUF4153 domain-containing protein [Kiritimatiellae bacterium]|nr:DUF4153 domain-containing protein [Kiritimatiellia bacterium]